MVESPEGAIVILIRFITEWTHGVVDAFASCVKTGDEDEDEDDDDDE